MTVVEVLELFEACSLMFAGAVLALGNRDTISSRTRRHGVLRIDGVLRLSASCASGSMRSVLKFCSELLVVLVVIA